MLQLIVISPSPSILEMIIYIFHLYSLYNYDREVLKGLLFLCKCVVQASKGISSYYLVSFIPFVYKFLCPWMSGHRWLNHLHCSIATKTKIKFSILNKELIWNEHKVNYGKIHLNLDSQFYCIYFHWNKKCQYKINNIFSILV